MSKPYAIVSDQHFHLWSAFSASDENGMNTRLKLQLAELRRCADELKTAGGSLIINAGDTFHVRGSLAPSVLNPVLDLHRELIQEGFEIVILAGNHDLESRDAARISSAVTALEGVGCKIINEPSWVYGKLMLPWIPNIAELKKAIDDAAGTVSRDHVDLFLHAPVDGVIIGLPDHGLDGAYLAGLGFRRVFTGHYHHHKEIAPGKVWSIGATTHQTWSDVGSKAGFLIVDDKGVNWRKSHAPEFVEIDGTTKPEEVAMIVDGNYVRCKVAGETKASEVEALRQFLLDQGAKGVVVNTQGKTGATRATATVSAGASLDVSVNDFIKAQTFARQEELSKLCQDILDKARMGAEV